MKYPSTTLINVEDKKIQEEVRKADLDLLSKINEISGGGGETNIFRTTLTTELTEKIRGTVGQKITIWKSNGSGTGEIKLATEDSKKFLWNGAAYDNIYVGLPGQHVTILPEDEGYYIVDGVVQPVALEPDVGGGKHYHHYQFATNVTLLVGTVIYYLEASIIALGVKSVFIVFDGQGGAWSALFVRDSAGNTFYTGAANAAGGSICGSAEIKLNNDNQIRFTVVNTQIVTFNGHMTFYDLGPA